MGEMGGPAWIAFGESNVGQFARWRCQQEVPGLGLGARGSRGHLTGGASGGGPRLGVVAVEALGELGRPAWIAFGGGPGGRAGGPRGAAPGGGARSTYHVTLALFKRPSPQKVTQKPNWATHFVWDFCRARTTPIVKISPSPISGTVNCCMDFDHPNMVGESV